MSTRGGLVAAPRIRRVLVAIDASAPSLAALEAAARIAACMDAELTGLFVEDVDLLRLAGLPFAAEIDLLLHVARPVDAEEVERRLRAQAQRARRSLAAAALSRRLRWTFRVARGHVVTELLAAEADLIALGTMSRLAGRSRVGSTARAVLERAMLPLLILPHRATIDVPIGVLYDGSSGTTRALALAAELARASDAPLVILVLADDRATEERLRESAQALAERFDVRPLYRVLVDAETATLTQAVRESHVGTLALSSGARVPDADAVATLLERGECAVLWVHGTSTGAAGSAGT